MMIPRNLNAVRFFHIIRGRRKGQVGFTAAPAPHARLAMGGGIMITWWEEAKAVTVLSGLRLMEEVRKAGSQSGRPYMQYASAIVIDRIGNPRPPACARDGEKERVPRGSQVLD